MLYCAVACLAVCWHFNGAVQSVSGLTPSTTRSTAMDQRSREQLAILRAVERRHVSVDQVRHLLRESQVADGVAHWKAIGIAKSVMQVGFVREELMGSTLPQGWDVFAAEWLIPDPLASHFMSCSDEWSALFVDFINESVTGGAQLRERRADALNDVIRITTSWFNDGQVRTLVNDVQLDRLSTKQLASLARGCRLLRENSAFDRACRELAVRAISMSDSQLVQVAKTSRAPSLACELISRLSRSGTDENSILATLWCMTLRFDLNTEAQWREWNEHRKEGNDRLDEMRLAMSIPECRRRLQTMLMSNQWEFCMDADIVPLMSSDAWTIDCKLRLLLGYCHVRRADYEELVRDISAAIDRSDENESVVYVIDRMTKSCHLTWEEYIQRRREYVRSVAPFDCVR